MIALVAMTVLLLVGLAPMAHIVADRLPQAPADPTPIADGAPRSDATAVRALPIGLPVDVTISSIAEIRPFAIAALGLSSGQELANFLTSAPDVDPVTKPNPSSSLDFAYPYRYPAIDDILTKASADQLRSGATTLAAALIKFAGKPVAQTVSANPARVAYAVLDHVREAGGCEVALNLLLLVAADTNTTAQILADESSHAERACPGDPTPGWVVGQAQMRSPTYQSDPRPTQVDTTTTGAMAASRATFEHLAERFPGDAWVRSGLGDSYLRSGLRTLYSQPFTARDYLQRAVAQYNRAAEFGDTLGADVGRARALVGLGQPDQAATLATRAAGSSRPGAALEVLLNARQTAHDMPAAIDAARRLDRAGASAYPPVSEFFPMPTTTDRGLPFDTTLPLSSGANTLAPLHVSLAPVGGAGGSVEDLSFIPQYRDDGVVTAALTDCAALAWRRDAIAAGHAAEALADWPPSFTGSRPAGVCQYPDGPLRAVAEVAAGRPLTSANYRTIDGAFDSWQNLLRWAGDLNAAHQAISRWQAQVGEDNAAPLYRLGEVEFLAGKYNDAAARFAEAAQRTRLAEWNDDLGVGRAQLDRAAALLKAGRNDEAMPILLDLQDAGTKGYAYRMSKGDRLVAPKFVALAYHASVQLADHYAATGNLNGAVDNYRSALALAPLLAGNGIKPEVVHNNLALAYLGLGDLVKARDSVAAAVDSDAKNPVFLMSAGFIAERAGIATEAVSDNRRALQSDPGAFPAANDLGVQLARAGDDAAAAAALRQAIGAKPDYALGWFNLGIVEARRGPLHLLASQGAFARAFRLDPTLKDRRRDLLIDGSVYRTALDLSKPLPPQWSLAQSQKAAPAASIGLLAAALVAVGLVRSSGDRGGELARQWLEPLSERLSRIRGPDWLRRTAVGIIVTVLAFLLTYFRHATGPTEIVAYCLGVAAIGALALVGRKVVATRRNVVVTQGAWPPGLALGLITGAIGTPWAPLPVATTDAESGHVHLAAPAVLAGLSVVLFVEAAWLGVPLTLALAIAAIIMAGSTLLPIKPLDGANLGKTGIVASAGVILGGVFIVLGLA